MSLLVQPQNENNRGNQTGAVTLDGGTGNLIRVVATGNVTLALANLRPGATYFLIFEQDGIGGRSLAFANAAEVSQGGSLTQPLQAAGAITIYMFVGPAVLSYPTVTQGIYLGILANSSPNLSGEDVTISATDDVLIAAGDDIVISAVGVTSRMTTTVTELISDTVTAGSWSASATGGPASVTSTNNAASLIGGTTCAVTAQGGTCTVSATAGSVVISAAGAGNDVTISAPDDVILSPTDDLVITGDAINASMGAGGVSLVSSGSHAYTSSGGGMILTASGGVLSCIGTGGTTIRSGVGGTLTLDVNAVTRMRCNSTGLAFFAAAPVAQQAAIPDAAGGATIDAEARTALNALLAAARLYGLIAP